MIENYRFPVELRDVYTKRGDQVPRVKAVVRTDTEEPISAVSHNYRLIPHGDLVDAAEKFVKDFGEPERSFSMNQNGTVLMGEYTYRENPVQLACGDTVGMKLYISNSYNSSSSMRIRIGALVLKCLNGMVSFRQAFDYSVRHYGKALQEIAFPEPYQISAAFNSEIDRWDHYNGFSIKDDVVRLDIIKDAWAKGLVTAKGVETIAEKPANTMWDMMQNFTYHVTHETPKLSPIGRVQRLESVSRYLDTIITTPQKEVES
jgi:hypothetical protein